MTYRRLTPCWMPCSCENYWCVKHGQHAHDCDCPSIDEWGDVDPYLPLPAGNCEHLAAQEAALHAFAEATIGPCGK